MSGNRNPRATGRRGREALACSTLYSRSAKERGDRKSKGGGVRKLTYRDAIYRQRVKRKAQK